MTLEDQISQYCEQKEQESILAKSNKKLNASIKETLVANKLNSETVGKYTVSLETRVSESPDTNKMLEVLKAFWETNHPDSKCPFIRTQEYVDMNELESSMYKGDIPKDVMLALDACIIKKETTALTYKVGKES